MREWLKELWRKCQLVLIIAFGTVPVPVLLFAYGQPALLPYAWIFLAVYVIAAAITLILPGKWRLVLGVVTVAAGIATSALLPAEESRLLMAAGAVLYALPFLWGLQLGGWSRDMELPVLWYCLGVLCHLAMQVMLFSQYITGETILEAWKLPALVSFFVFAGLTLLSMNRRNMADAAGGWKWGASAGMRRINRMLTLTLFVLSVVISLIPGLVQAAGQLAGKLLAALLTAIFTTNQGQTPSAGGAAAPLIPDELLGDPEQTSALMRILDTVGYVLGSVLTVAVLLLGLRLLIREMRGGFSRMGAYWHRYAASAAEDYTDEITDSRDSRGASTVRPDRRRRQDRRELRGLAPEQQVRVHYGQLLQKHRHWKAGSTARENLPEEAASTYERARYSDHPVTAREAEDFLTATKRI